MTTFGRRAGDTLILDRAADGSICISHRAGATQAVRMSLFEEARDRLRCKLIGAYVSGFGLVEGRFDARRGPFVRKVEREFCRPVIDPEVLEETRNSIALQDLSDPTEPSSEQCLRRMHLVVRAMRQDAVIALKTSNAMLAHAVVQRDVGVGRLYWMISKRHHLARHPRAGVY